MHCCMSLFNIYFWIINWSKEKDKHSVCMHVCLAAGCGSASQVQPFHSRGKRDSRRTMRGLSKLIQHNVSWIVINDFLYLHILLRFIRGSKFSNNITKLLIINYRERWYFGRSRCVCSRYVTGYCIIIDY